MLLVTHDADVAARADRVVAMLDGRAAPSGGVPSKHAALRASAVGS